MRARIVCLAAALLAAAPVFGQEWKPADGPLMTRWAKEVSPENALPEYPRPQMVREKWQNLNGLWDYAITPKEAETKPGSYAGKILVPFAVESALSGVMKRVGAENKLVYRRTFTIPEDWKGQNVLLHFGAVDWRATVTVNGKELGTHEGGYDPFSFDVTAALKEGGEQELVVTVWDPTDAGPQPRGKQVNKPGGIFYTPVTGIWQTVWIEPVHPTHVASLALLPEIDGNRIRVTSRCIGTDAADTNYHVEITVTDPVSGRVVGTDMGPPNTERVVRLKEAATRWTPENPHLYDVKVGLFSLKRGGKTGLRSDEIKSYVGMRKIEVAKDEQGVNRLMLNGEPVFQFGPLDQGWWPDGLYTAPTDAALKYDLEVTKQLGFNMCRKHVKTEPARWYYHCDKLGLMVWQDMPNGDRHIGPSDPDIVRSAESEAIYRKEWTAIVNALKNHPCIVAWVPFNEGWGQFKTNEYLAFTKSLDPTRPVDGPSGWADRGEGDMHDMHKYPAPGMFPAGPDRASVLGEFGGLGLAVPKHLWKEQDNWGYRSYENQDALIRAYTGLIRQIPALKGKGLSAAVYTQTTDVETEINGFMTYDRAVIKLPAERVGAVNRSVYAPAPREVVVAATSEREPQTYRFTTSQPADGWEQPEFDASGWKTGPGGLGTEGTPGARVRTTWNTPDIWLRRTVTLDPANLHALGLRIHHDEDATVYLNGVKVAELSGYVSEYADLPLDEAAKKAVRKGENVIAVHCKQTGGGQYVDVGIVDLVPAEAK